MIRQALLCIALASGLSACQTTQAAYDAPDLTAERPPGAPPGTCWGKTDTPALIETVTEQVQLSPAETDASGRVTRPATYATETRQAILQERVTTWFETPCRDVRTPDFVASVQRALAARDLYRGPITTRMDTRTRAAIQRYQAPRGLDSGTLSLDSARNLGLVAAQLPE
ncbi:peptidoglycan-binding domain-containing protein [uncultured Roseovarius sp.]|uniref:peptidoglycan-binding domain-containing protein n=1 Tax=uncultured Roseovarius sp. TaxID=293344 RepID=UPI0026361598|nr:peptidoglycan-binding domain-containing protein [uncultured Roseovarius sp.]